MVHFYIIKNKYIYLNKTYYVIELKINKYFHSDHHI